MAFGQAKAIARFTPGFRRRNPMLATVNALEQIRPLNVNVGKHVLSEIIARFCVE